MNHRLTKVGFWLIVLGANSICGATVENEFASFRQPAEFEPQEAVWLCADPDDPQFLRVTAEMAKALLPHVKVKMIAEKDEALAKAKLTLQTAGVRVEQIEFLVDPLDTYFMRDAAVYLIDGHGAMALLDLKWSDYGLPGWGKRLYPDNPERAAKVAGHLNTAADGLEQVLANVAKAKVLPSKLYLENATFEVNGKGVLLISEPLALERNPELTRDEIEQHLRAIPGVRKVIWLGEGVAQDPLEISTIEGNRVGMGAGGHTDEFVRFTDPSTILLAWQEDDAKEEHALHRINRERMTKNYDILVHATDQDGKPFRVIKVPMPAVVEQTLKLAAAADESTFWHYTAFPAREGRKEGDVVLQVAAATYLNFIIANEIVLVPSFVEDGTAPAVQERVKEIMQNALPGRKIQFIHCTPLTYHGGGLHCATLSEPKR